MYLYGTKQWKCKNGHVLGVVEQVKVGKRRMTRLMLFRQAIDLRAQEAMAEVDVIANIEGTTLDVRCSVPGCGEVRSWFMGEAVTKIMLERMKEKEGRNG